MKIINIVTYHRAINYGAFLQCFALQKKLRNNGYDVYILDHQPIADKKRYRLIQFNSIKELIKSIILLPQNMIKKHNFKKDYCLIRMTKNVKSDIAITGSDQVWNPILTGGKLDRYFTLEEVDADKKISYAASIGDEGVVKEYADDFKKILRRLDYVSVREEKAKNALRPLGKKKTEITIDPVFLLSKNEWEKEIKERSKKTTEGNYILSYFIGATSQQYKALSKISKNTNLKVISYSAIQKEKDVYKHCYTDGPFEFISKLQKSKLVITSSFHGTAFSIIFHKNFYVLMPNSKKRDRIDTILKLVGLTDRIIETEDDINKITLDDIDYTKPQIKLEAAKLKSYAWLKKALGGQNE